MSHFDHRTASPRYTARMLVNKYVAGERVPHVCRAVNLSAHGMLLHKIHEPALAPGQVELELQVPDYVAGVERVIRLRGVVLAESPTARAHAVRFTLVSSEAQALLDAYRGEALRDSESEPRTARTQ